MFFTAISIAFVVMVLVAIFIYRHYYIKNKSSKENNP
jgi:hypothetical protein